MYISTEKKKQTIFNSKKKNAPQPDEKKSCEKPNRKQQKTDEHLERLLNNKTTKGKPHMMSLKVKNQQTKLSKSGTPLFDNLKCGTPLFER